LGIDTYRRRLGRWLVKGNDDAGSDWQENKA
jgi:hypothetical protein